MTQQGNRLVAMVTRMISGGATIDWVREELTALGQDPETVSATIAEYQRLTGQIRTFREPSTIVRQPGLSNWYPGPQPDHIFWPALKGLLEEKDWSAEAISSVDRASSRILSLMQPPGLAEFSTKGLVLGYVQSGKTTNFTALISKAADVNYKLFIVLGGVHNALRAQTQKRLYDEIVALNTQHWIEITQQDSDFTPSGVGNVDSFLTDHTNQKVLGVVKKNATVLRRLRDWLRGASPHVMNNCPILIIDDEADQASINTTGDSERRSRINTLLLEILRSAPKAAYVGYTATPFANLFIDPSIDDDLYPSDFIVDLPRPKEYYGAESLFGREPLDSDDKDPDTQGLDMIRDVPDSEKSQLQPRSRVDRFDFVPEVTPSLRRALLYFWLATAARRSRGDDGHSSMLVHTTLYVDAHMRMQTTIDQFRIAVLDRLKNGDSTLIGELSAVWEEESGRVFLPPESPRWTSFDDLFSETIKVVEDSKVPVENNQSLQRLTYTEPGAIQVVVGGNVLSRGLTLEGLTVSYFIRTSTAYDTLLQMGRWFGYRRGYEELPRIWMSPELQGYFHDLATVEREIRNDVAVYEQSDKTPLDFAVRVQTHPKLAITAKAKMGSAVESKVSYSDQRPQTILFNHQDSAWLKHNQDVVNQFVGSIESSGKIFQENLGTYRVARGLQPASVIDLLKRYRVVDEAVDFRPDRIVDYIREQNARHDLLQWNVVLAGQSNDVVGAYSFSEQTAVPMIERSALRSYEGREYTSIGTLADRLDWVADLETEHSRNDLRKMRSEDLRALRPSGIGSVILYPIYSGSMPGSTRRSKNPRIPLNAVENLIGMTLVFPKAERDTPQSYKSADLSSIQREEDEDPEENQEGS